MPHKLSELRLLVLEDEPLIGLDITETLQQAGAAAVDLARSVAAARDCLGAGASPHIALLDIIVPDGPPFDLARELISRGTVVVFATGYGSGLPPDLAHCALLEKPFTPDDLIAAVTAAFKASQP